MNLQEFLILHKNNNKISQEGKKELFEYFERLNKYSLVDLDIEYNNIDCYQEDNIQVYYNKFNIDEYTIYKTANKLINIYNGKALYIK